MRENVNYICRCGTVNNKPSPKLPEMGWYRQVEDKGSKIWMSAAFLVGLTMVDPMNFAKNK